MSRRSDRQSGHGARLSCRVWLDLDQCPASTLPLKMIFAIGFRLRGELPMKRLLWIAAGWSVLLATVTAYAQQNQNPTTSEPPYGYYHMWGGPWGWHAGFIFGPIMMLLVIVGIVALIVLLLRGF